MFLGSNGNRKCRIFRL